MSKKYTYEEALRNVEKLSKENWDEEESNAVLSALIDQHRNDNSDDNWDDFGEMMIDMKNHAQNNGRAIIEEDRPVQLRIAYRCTNTNKTWSIKINKLRDYTEKLKATGEQLDSGKNKGDVISLAMSSQEGKQKLLEMINETLS